MVLETCGRGEEMRRRNRKQGTGIFGINV